MTNTSKLEDDDALGFALRAFVEQSRQKGISDEEMTFVLIASAVRAALDGSPSYAGVLAAAMNAVTCASNIFSNETRTRRATTQESNGAS